jgi:hypothetical protein
MPEIGDPGYLVLADSDVVALLFLSYALALPAHILSNTWVTYKMYCKCQCRARKWKKGPKVVMRTLSNSTKILFDTPGSARGASCHDVADPGGWETDCLSRLQS